MREDCLVRGDGRGDTLHIHLPEGAQRAADRRGPVGAPADELADQIVVERADLVAGLVARVEARAEPVGHHQLGDAAR